LLVPTKTHRAPVAAPKTDAFGRPLDAAGKVIEPPRPPPKRVEESSSSESESDDEAGGLFSIAKENKSPPKIRKAETRKVQLLGEPVRSRIAMQARDRNQQRVPSERNIRARLQPDTKPLLKRVLAWTPGHSGTFPPGTTQDDYKKVATTFASPNKYEETYEPLLMLECWQHILQAKSETLEVSFDFTIENRQRTDEYVDLFVTMKPMTYANVNLMDPDLVILSNNKGRGGKECFAQVKGHKKKWDTVELSLRCIPSPDIAALLVPKATMFGTKLFRFVP
jgi:senataxin